MATSFIDNFNRADGPVGGSWTVTSGTLNISDNALTGSGAGATGYPSTGPISPNQAVRVFLRDPGSYAKPVRLRLRWNVVTGDYYQCIVTMNASALAIQIGYYDAGVAIWTLSRSIGISWTPIPDVVFSIAQQTLLVAVNGTLVLAAWTADLADNGVTGIQFGATGILVEEYHQFNLGDTSGQLLVEDSSEGEGHYQITIENPARNWTPGDPGAPTFTARAGTVTSQIVTSTDEAVLQYLAPSILSDDTIVDPNTGYEYPFVIGTLAQAPTGGEGGGLTPEQTQTMSWWHELLDALNQQPGTDNSLLVKLWDFTFLAQSHREGSPNPAFEDLLNAILDSTSGVGAIKQIVQSTWDRLDDTTDQGDLTLNTIQNNIRGTNLPSIHDVLDAIAALTPHSNLDVLNELAAIRTANNWTLGTIVDLINGLDIPPADTNQNVLDELARIRTANNWSLGTIVDLINGLDIPDYSATLSDIHADVNAIPLNTVTSLQPVLDAVSLHNTNLNTKAQAILDAIAAIEPGGITSLQPVLDAISALDSVVDSDVAILLAAIEAIVPGSGKPTAPVWPGLSGVNLGTPVSLATGVTLTGTMHGVIINLTYVPPETEHYVFDATNSYVHIGALAFRNDDNAFEGFQPFSFGKHILTPSRLVQASGCVIRCGIGIVGTVTPWTLKAGA